MRRGGDMSRTHSWAERLDPTLLARLVKHEDRHKYDYGHALVLCGASGHGGAARLAARAALRIGAGLVTLACPPEALLENAARLDAVMLRPLTDAAALGLLLNDVRMNALCIGPGLGVSEPTRAYVCEALKTTRPILLDADALTSFAEMRDALFGALHDNAVLTPHAGEFERLFPDEAAATVWRDHLM